MGRVMRLSRLGKGAVDDSEATPLEGRGSWEPLGIREAGYNKYCDVRGGVSFGDHTYGSWGDRAEVCLPIDLVE